MKVTVNDVGGFWLQFTASIRHLHMERGMLDLLLLRGARELAFAISIATLMLIGVGESMREERPLLCGVMLWTRTLGTNRLAGFDFHVNQSCGLCEGKRMWAFTTFKLQLLSLSEIFLFFLSVSSLC